MFRRVAIILPGAIACLGLAYQGGLSRRHPLARNPKQAAAEDRASRRFLHLRYFLERRGGSWDHLMRLLQVRWWITSANLEFKAYGPSATASDPDKRIWISGPPANIWTGMCTTPFAATLRNKNNYVDLTGMAKVRWTTRASGFHVVRPLIKLMDGTFLVGDRADASTTTFLESEFTFAGLRWMKLDIDRVVTVGRYGPLGDASNWAEAPDLSKVDEVGFVDLMPGSGHGSGGWVNVAEVELYGIPVKRDGAQ